ncbi:MAG: arabinofuranosyltransferase [Thermoleophilaceae bacterium]|jgi:arabinofuranosyltransferase|nr:arabinofuranosyltransferase [Thermoleophilaceae bacterium]
MLSRLKGRNELWLRGVAILLPALALAVVAWSHRWMSDDGFINLRVTQNLLDGHGPVFNVGERVEAYTSPLWIALLTVGQKLTFGLPLEWVAVLLGMGFASVGLAAASLGSARLWDAPADAGGRARVPVGALVVLALPPFWDFASSGLETGLSFAWLGLTFLGLVECIAFGSEAVTRRRLGRALRQPAPIAVLVGLGPLVRPDFAIFSVALLAALVYARWPARRWRALTALVWAVALPAAYEVFRAGYFAALVPTTALAKSAGESRWHRGWTYLLNLVEPYWLWVPAAALCVLVLALLRSASGRDRGAVAVLAACVGSGLIHVVYVTRVGGDFMHARLLLPSVFALMLPAMLVPIPRRLVERAAIAVVAVWALVAGATLRYPQAEARPEIDNLREAYVQGTGDPHPVRLGAFRALSYMWEVDGEYDRELAQRMPAIVAFRTAPGPKRIEGRPATSLRASVVDSYEAIGLAGYAAGPNVYIVDLHGLAEPIAARTEAASTWRAGHEKMLPNAWTLARFADPASLHLTAASARAVEAARRAIGCGELHDLLRAIEEPLDAGRFVDNLGAAVRLRSLRVPRDPEQAARALCGAG